MQELILIRGLPGSGKSTLAKRLGHCHYEADMYFINSLGDYIFDYTKLKEAHDWCQKMTLETLYTTDSSVIVSNTFTTIRELKPYFIIAKKFGITPAVLTCSNTYGSTHSVPTETLKIMKDRFQYDISELFT